MTRESDLQSHDSAQVELGHVYDRLKKLEEGQAAAQGTLHALQIKLTEVAAAGYRFPGWLPNLLGSILIVLVAQSAGAIWWASGINSEVASFQEMKGRLTSAFQGMRSAETNVASIQQEHVRIRDVIHEVDRRCQQNAILEERLNALSEKVVGKTDNGWHKADHEQYAQYIEERFKRLEALIGARQR